MGRRIFLLCMCHKRPAFSCYRGARDVMTGVTARDAIFFPPVVAKRKEEGIRFNLCGEKRQLSHTQCNPQIYGIKRTHAWAPLYGRPT